MLFQTPPRKICRSLPHTSKTDDLSQEQKNSKIGLMRRTNNVYFRLHKFVTKSYICPSFLTRNAPMYADTPLRRPTFDASKLIKQVNTFFADLFNAYLQARRMQAAMNTAHHLKATNRDFANLGYHDLVQLLLDDQHPRHLDGSLVSK